MLSMKTFLTIFLVFAKCVIGIPYDYYAYKDYYSEIETNTTEIPQSEEMHFQVRCSSEYVTMTYVPSLLPEELSIVMPESADKESGCILKVDGVNYSTYRIQKSCHKLVVQDDSFVKHSLLLGDTENRNLYTITLECESVDNVETVAGVIQIFENRIAGENCEEISCPYGARCMDRNLVDGFYCVCSSDDETCQASCPPDHYGCRRIKSNQSGKIPQNLKCINNKWLCNYRFDCELEDDEKPCKETWSDWGEWSQCDTQCGKGKGHRVRTRMCAVVFVPDPERCRLTSHKRGCERECTNNNETQSESEPCRAINCPSVKCRKGHMLMTIPKEAGMTTEDIQRFMTVGDTGDCKPSDNETHVILTIPLHECGTTSMIEGSSVVYENRATYNANAGTPSIITREMGRVYTASCRYERRGKVTLKQHNPGPKKSVEVAALSFETSQDGNWAGLQERDLQQFASGDGEFEFRMDLFKNESFNARYINSDYPLHKHLREKLFVSVHFQTEDEDLKVLIDRCTATPTIDSNDTDEEYIFLEDRCAVDPTVKFYDFPDNRRDGFSIEAFKFSNAEFRFVYLQCDVIVCDVIDKDCVRECDQISDKKLRSKRNVGVNTFAKGHVIQGPIVIADDHEPMNVWKEMTAPIDSDIEENDQESTNLLYVITAGLSSLFVGILIGVLTRRKKKAPTNV